MDDEKCQEYLRFLTQTIHEYAVALDARMTALERGAVQLSASVERLMQHVENSTRPYGRG